ncbi:hypothetical protein M427DRAFT_389934 [Gonapodya prolifera JEL478]|uniref:Uncharacterized protein n=1 Tax=Gonapodya prolifera (strain JEL478) TaxID=1344416 RepID=A0A139A7V9_GONPJ|nr:hypothetical protein M427DRAFT_389934 [Gonapodya prolifera JEL478]|eukprot:KXS12870.1 hypothetical protein M427DRAFT_389934 [Gonapodya prolifera JEL478]
MSNGRLIAAIEKRDSSEIYKALREEKADPNSRKQISLKVKIGNNWTTDTIWAESALSLAVIYGRLDYVRALINAGADVEAPVEWRIPNYNPGLPNTRSGSCSIILTR